MAKYSKQLVERICELISADSYTIAEICEKVEISEAIFYKWKSEKVEFLESIKKAQDQFNDMLVIEAKKSLVKMVKGYTVKEKRTVTADTGKVDENGKKIVKIKEHSVTEKHYQPVPSAVYFTLTNRDPDNWKHRQENAISGEIGIKSALENLSDEELQDIVNGKAN
jgi:transposase-like protein